MDDEFDDTLGIPAEEISRGNFSVRLETKAKNGALVKAREKLCLSSREVAEQIGVSYYTYLSCETMKYFPGKKVADKIINFYSSNGIPMFSEDVFPEELRTAKFPSKYIHHQEIPRELLIPLSDPSLRKEITYMETNMERQELAEQIDQSLSTLTPREQRVLRWYFDLNDDGETLTYDQIGEKLGVTKSRVQQIKEKAVRRLRHAARSKNLKDFL